MGKPSFLKSKKADIPIGEERRSRKRSADFPSKALSGAMTKSMKRTLSSRFFRFERAFSHLLSHVSARAYGAIMLSFGLLSLILYFLGIYPDRGMVTPIIALSFSVLAIPFLLSDKSLPYILQRYSLTDFIIFDFLGIKRTNKADQNQNVPAFAAILIGVALSLMGCLVPLWQVVTVVGIAIFVYISFVSPEFVFFVSFLVLPYSSLVPRSEIIFPCIVGLALLSFVRKVLYGKRVINLEKYDLCIGLFLFMILISGIFLKGVSSFSRSVEMVIMAAGYMLAGNIIANRRLADRIINSLIFTSTIPAIISIVQLAVAFWKAASLSISVDGVLARADGVAVYLLAAVIFAASLARHSAGILRAAYIVSAVLNFVALLISGEIFAIIALILSIPAYRVLRSNRRLWLKIPLLLALPYLLFIVPEAYLDRIFYYAPSLGTAHEMLVLWGKCLMTLGNNLLFGIGIGAESFAEEMAKVDILGYPDSGNLFIEIGLEAGIFALLFFLLILVVRMRHRRSYFPYVRSSQVSTNAVISEVCMFAFISYGCMNYIWSDISAYYLFWTVFGIGSATLRVAKREHDDLVFYYEDLMAQDSSALDVEIA